MVDPERRAVRRAVVLTSSGALVAIVAFAAFLFRPSPVLGVDGEALQHSVGGSLDPSETCEHLGDRAWSCSHYDRQMSGGVEYRVKVNALGCWQATRGRYAGDGGSPKHLSGCMTIVDFILG